MSFLRNILGLLLLCAATSAIAQSTDTTALKQTQIKLNLQLFAAGFSVEQRLNNDISLYAEGGYRTVTGSYYSRNNFSTGLKNLVPFVGIESRYYYNFTKRIAKQKNTGNN
jgi:hypothetical protein